MSAWSKGRQYSAFPTLIYRFAFNRYLPNEFSQPLDQCAVRNIVPELVKFTGDEEAIFLGNGPLNFTDEGGLADTGGSRDQNHLGPSLADSLQDGLQFSDFILPAVQPRGDL